jgi:hypothetical protein
VQQLVKPSHKSLLATPTCGVKIKNLLVQMAILHQNKSFRSVMIVADVDAI